MGGKYVVGGHGIVRDAMEAESLGDDFGKQGVVWAPIPETIAAEHGVLLWTDVWGGHCSDGMPSQQRRRR